MKILARCLKATYICIITSGEYNPHKTENMKLNAHKIALIEAAENGTLAIVVAEKAAESFRLSSIGMGGYKNGWSLDQHVECFTQEAADLMEEKAAGQAPKAKSSYTSRRNEVTVKNGFAGTARDHARGFDGIE